MAESTRVLTQLQHYQLNLLQARIQLNKFGSTAPHLFTIFQSHLDQMWYIDAFTHTRNYKSRDGSIINNHFLLNQDFYGYRRNQYIARFQLNNEIEIWKWKKFEDISKNQNIENNNELIYFHTNYLQQQVYNRQFTCTRSGGYIQLYK